MKHLTVAFDPGTSRVKVIYKIGSGKPKLLTMGPEYIVLPADLADSIESATEGFGLALPEDEAWVRLKEDGDFHVVGRLATTFKATTDMDSLKHESSLFKILATIGAIAQKEELGRRVALDLAVLLPLSEYKDGEQLYKDLFQHLKSFYFRGERLRVTLKHWSCLPEGGGIIMSVVNGIGEERFQENNVCVVMFGHRNTSFLLFERGSRSPKSCTTDLGFYQMLDKIIAKSSGQSRDSIMQAFRVTSSDIVGAYNYSIFSAALVKTSRAENREREKQELEQAITSALKEYWLLLENWLDRLIPDPRQLERIIICGGAAVFLESEIRSYFRGATVDFGTAVWIEQITKHLSLSIKEKQELAFRLADVYGMFVDFVAAHSESEVVA
jgi:hypothetical protein